ncbi:MAG TPA: lipoyl(octanoyl) transferase LipB [Gemmataceae bacterium]|nr:lipoyl(octanoyl) transferase LipB [Gemmataceae bacterium]
MSAFAPPTPESAAGAALQAYLLGTVEFEAALALQRHLVYHVAGERERAALILCEHPPAITVGRQGSRAHILYEPEELRSLRWGVRWVNRGGGCLLHLPGQMAIYPILPLDRLGLGLQAYLDRLRQVIIDVLADFSVPATSGPDGAAVYVGARPVAHLGVAVRDWVSYYGAAFNVYPDLEPLRRVRTGPDAQPMTSLERERRGPLRAALVRERFLEHFVARFGFGRLSLFFNHPALGARAGSGTVTSRP